MLLQDFLAYETAMHSSKKMLHLQEKSCLYKKICRLQENLAKARNCAFATKSCKSKNIFPLNVNKLLEQMAQKCNFFHY